MKIKYTEFMRFVLGDDRFDALLQAVCSGDMETTGMFIEEMRHDYDAEVYANDPDWGHDE